MVNSPLVSELQLRKDMGRAHLNANRLQQALEVYAAVLADYPDDVEACLLLGDCYLAGGDAAAAVSLYARARKLAPRDGAIDRRLRLAQIEASLDPAGPGEPAPMDPQAVLRLSRRILGRANPVPEGEVTRAAGVLDEVLRSPQPAAAVAGKLDEIDELLPGLLELNIRRARADGRPDLAGALEVLLQSAVRQPNTQGPVPKPARTRAKPAQSATAREAVAPRVLFVGPPDLEGEPCRNALAQALGALGCDAGVSEGFSRQPGQGPGVIIARHPHVDPCLMDSLMASAAAGARIVLDLDVDLQRMPRAHPDYARVGLATPAREAAHATALRLARAIRVPSHAMADPLRAAGYKVRVIPPCLGRRDDGEQASAPGRPGLQVGWIDSAAHRDDLAAIRRPVIQALKEFPHAQLVAAGDPGACQLFEALPESQRWLPEPASGGASSPAFERPDVLLVPRRDTPFNCSLSDERLMEAGAHRVPWVASPIPAHEAWGVGGLLARSHDEWRTGIRRLLADAGLRAALGEAGHRRAEERSVGRAAVAWLEMIRESSNR